MHTSRTKTRPLGGGLLVGSTKRKPTVKCAAANDDEDLGGLFEAKSDDGKPEEKRAKAEPPEKAADAAGSGQGTARKKKEFAWMDSESEDGDAGGGQEEEKVEREVKEDHDEERPRSTEVEVTVEELDKCQSFGRMMLLAPSLQKWLGAGRRGPADIVAACKALARTKFFDGDIIEEVYSVLRKQLRGDRLDIAQTNDAILCLKTLNAYDKGVFSAVAKAFKAKTASMDAGMRTMWLEIFKGFDHDLEPDFVQLLEVPPLAPSAPGFRKVRCWHHSRGHCVLEGTTCTFSHDARAPLSLGEGGREDWWRSKSVMMTQNQKTLGDGAYGLGPLGRGGPLHGSA